MKFGKRIQVTPRVAVAGRGRADSYNRFSTTACAVLSKLLQLQILISVGAMSAVHTVTVVSKSVAVRTSLMAPTTVFFNTEYTERKKMERFLVRAEVDRRFQLS